MSQGIIYYNRGYSCIPRLLVSLHSLREHSKQPITVFMEGQGLKALSDSIQKTLDVDIIYDANASTTTYVRAVEVCIKSPYDSSIWIDADTLVMNNFDEIFEDITDHDLCISNFCGWLSKGSGIKRRILRYSNLIDQNLIDNAINYGPAINCGVYGFRKNYEFLNEWLTLSKIGEKNRIFIPDEIACQILLPKYKVKILPQEYNVSVKYGKNISDAKIIHYHGRKHCRNFKLSELWINKFIDLLKNNFCNIRDYVGHDRMLKKFLNYKYENTHLADKCNSILNNKHIPIKKSNSDILSNVTVVTACDQKYIDCLKLTMPTWIKNKNILQFPIIVYVNGFTENDKRLDFLRKHKNISIIHWDMCDVSNHREKMLSAFVYGPARDVKTKYWLKIDADAYATNNNPLVKQDMVGYDIVGHRWGYTKPYIWLETLNKWAKNNKIDYIYNIDKNNIKNNRYYHKRTNSFIQLHSTEFTRIAAALSKDRLPVPSQDTYLWFVSQALRRPIRLYNFKRFGGMRNKRNAHQLEKVLSISKIENIKLHVGCGRKNYAGWMNTDKNQLDITNTESWYRNSIQDKSIYRILAEHVFEHLSDGDRRLAIQNFKKFLLPKKGIIRIAVPDGYHIDQSYIEKVKVGGTGKSAYDHKFLYTYQSLVSLFGEYGFDYNLLEYFDENGIFHNKDWHTEDGFIKRSSKYDRRNKNKPLSYTSLIVDFYLNQ